MIVHFIAPSVGHEEKKEVIEGIRCAVASQGHILTEGAWSNSPTMTEMSLGLLDQEEWELLCKRDIELLNVADIVIVEVSNKATFGTGYMAALALIASKPTLFLLQEDSVRGSFTAGLKHSMLTRKTYNSRNVEQLVKDFLETSVK